MTLLAECMRFSHVLYGLALSEIEAFASSLSGAARPTHALQQPQVAHVSISARHELARLCRRVLPRREVLPRALPDLAAGGQRQHGQLALSGLGRLATTVEAQRVRLAALLESYLHWRMPLVRWWLLRQVEQRVGAPLSAPSAARRADAGGGGPLARVRALQADWRPPALGVPALELQGALLHLVPQILTKLRHATFHEPSAAGTFASCGLRLLLLVPLLQLLRLGGPAALSLRQQLRHLVLREAMRASERCDRVERRRCLQPPPMPRGDGGGGGGGPSRLALGFTPGEALFALAAASAARGARSLEAALVQALRSHRLRSAG